MNKLLKEDLSWKILSLGLAMILWLFVINTQNPSQPQTIRNIPVTIKGLEELEAQGYVLKNEEEIKNQAFSIIIRGPRLEVDKVYNNNLITVTLNLNQYTNDLNQDSIQCIANYVVNILLDNNSITITDKKPEFTSIVLEREASVTKTVEYEVIEGSTKNYELLGEPIISPTEIEIKGPKSAINEIDSVVVNIDGNTFSEEQLVQRLPVKIYDAEGNEITGLVTSPQTVEVRLLIGKFKQVPLKVNIIGKAQEGYTHLSTRCSEQTVTIVGKPEIIDKIKEINLEPIDISKLTETTVIRGKLELPEGVTTNSAQDISVTVEMDKENTYIYSLPVNMLNIKVNGLGSNLTYQIETQEIQVSISATAQEILDYSATEIAGNLSSELNLSGYDEGEHKLKLNLKATDKIKLLNDTADVDVKLTSTVVEEKPVEPTDTVTEDATESPTEVSDTSSPGEDENE